MSQYGIMHAAGQVRQVFSCCPIYRRNIFLHHCIIISYHRYFLSLLQACHPWSYCVLSWGIPIIHPLYFMNKRSLSKTGWQKPMFMTSFASQPNLMQHYYNVGSIRCEYKYIRSHDLYNYNNTENCLGIGLLVYWLIDWLIGWLIAITRMLVSQWIILFANTCGKTTSIANKCMQYYLPLN